MAARGTVFAETMTGTVRLTGEDHDRPVRLDLTVRLDGIPAPHRTCDARATGRLRIAGRADDRDVTGTLEISPLARRRIRYRLRFTADGKPWRLDGWKSVSPRRPLSSLTVLPFALHTDDGPAGRGTVRFSPATGLPPFLASVRFPRRDRATGLWAPRWTGTPGRTEVWYTTLTDPATGTGVWLHHELTAPSDGSPAVAHGWAAVFPPDGPVEHARFGPAPWPSPPPRDGFAAAGAQALPGRLRGAAGAFRWDLAERAGGPPLYTFPRWSWRYPLLPGAQIVAAPHARYSGTLRHRTGELTLRDAPGATARIHGHGHARRWAWLHADLGGRDVLEVVAAAPAGPGRDRWPALVFLRLRRNGRTWPRGGLRTAVGRAGAGRFTARIALPAWTVTGRAGLRRIRVEVTQPADRTLTLDYADPDGTPAVCRNSETADARVVLQRWWGRWRTEARWTLAGTAHAEVGHR
ncbi:hypothetical protein [Streptomyces sp. NPDC018031]|uniref:hypothetical protein n=1 Tax=Streptomyces sp. NPDC018031 TaxID=3365033 RepID=UPI003794CF56